MAKKRRFEEKSDKTEPVKPFRSYYDKDGDAR